MDALQLESKSIYDHEIEIANLNLYIDSLKSYIINSEINENDLNKLLNEINETNEKIKCLCFEMGERLRLEYKHIY